MSLKPLLEIANENERLKALRSALGSADGAVDAYVSAAMRPYVLAALIGAEDEAPPGPVRLVVAADDRSARDLAGDLKASSSRPAGSASIRRGVRPSSPISIRRRTLPACGSRR